MSSSNLKHKETTEPLAQHDDANAIVSQSTATSPRAKNIGLLILLGIGALVVSFLSQASMSPFITSGRPDLGKTDNPSYGYAYYYNGDLLHKENFYPMELVESFKQGRPGKPGGKLTFAKRRIYYSFLANHFTTFFNSNVAFRVLNFFLLFTAAYFIYRFSERVFREPAVGYLASLLFLLSSPATMFSGDLSPHLLAIAMYAVWSTLMLRYWDGKQDALFVAGLCAFLGAWSLSYSNVYYGLLAFIVITLARKKVMHALFGLAAVFGSSTLQELITNSFGVTFRSQKELLLLQSSIGIHWDHFLARPFLYGYEVLQATLDYFVADNPVVVLIGALGVVCYTGRHRLPLLALLFSPLLVTLPFFKTAGARGYIASSLLVALIPCCSAFVIRLFSANSFSRNGMLKLAGIFSFLVAAFWIYTVEWNAALVTVLVGIPLLGAFLLQTRAWHLSKLIALLSVCIVIGTQCWWNYAHFQNRPTSAHSFIYGVFRQVGGLQNFPVGPITNYLPNKPLSYGFRTLLYGTGLFSHNKNLKACFYADRPAHCGYLNLLSGVYQHARGIKIYNAKKDLPWKHQTHYISITGNADSIPKSLGGNKDWSEFVEDKSRQSSFQISPEKRRSPSTILENKKGILSGTLILQSLLITLTLGVIICLLPTAAYRLTCSGLFLALFFATTFWGSARGVRPESKFVLDQLVQVRAGQEVRGTIDISPKFIDALETAYSRGEIAHVDIYIKMSKIKRAKKVNLMFIDKALSDAHTRDVNLPLILTLPAGEFLNLMKERNYHLPFSVSMPDVPGASVYVGAWMRNEHAKGRHAELVDKDGDVQALNYIPAIEIRGRSHFKTYPIVGL